MSDLKYYPEEVAQIAKYGTVSDTEYNKILCDIWKKCDATQKGLFAKLDTAIHGSGEGIFPVLDELKAERLEERILENELNAVSYDEISDRNRKRGSAPSTYGRNGNREVFRKTEITEQARGNYPLNS